MAQEASTSAPANGKETVPQPKIRVVLPTATLRLEHITYLRNLATGDDKIKCELACGQIYRLRLLGLIEEYEIPPDPEEIKKHKKECEQVIEKMKKLVAKEDWKALGDVSLWELRRNAPEPQKANRVTKAAIELLKQSQVVVKLQKGCA